MNKKQTKNNSLNFQNPNHEGLDGRKPQLIRRCDPPPSEGCKRKLWHADSCRWLYKMKG